MRFPKKYCTKCKEEKFLKDWNTTDSMIVFSVMVFQGMLSYINKFKIFNSVVELISVQMMNMFASFKFSSNMVFHYLSMLKGFTKSKSSISLKSNKSSFPSWMIFPRWMRWFRKGFSFIGSFKKIPLTPIRTKLVFTSPFSFPIFSEAGRALFASIFIYNFFPSHKKIIVQIRRKNNI